MATNYGTTSPTATLATGTGAGTSAGTGYSTFRGSTTNEIDNVYRYVDTVKAMLEAKVDAAQSKMDGQMATLMAEFRTAEVQRSSDFDQVQRDFIDLKATLPTKTDITKSTRNWALGLGGFVVGLAGLLWAFFGTGAGITGALADKLLDTKSDQREISKKLDEILDKNDNDKPQAGSGTGQNQPVHQGTQGRP